MQLRYLLPYLWAEIWKDGWEEAEHMWSPSHLFWEESSLPNVLREKRECNGEGGAEMGGLEHRMTGNQPSTTLCNYSKSKNKFKYLLIRR